MASLNRHQAGVQQLSSASYAACRKPTWLLAGSARSPLAQLTAGRSLERAGSLSCF